MATQNMCQGVCVALNGIVTDAPIESASYQLKKVELNSLNNGKLLVSPVISFKFSDQVLN